MLAAPALPSPPGPLIGRTAELAQLRGLLTTQAVRLVTVTGPPGVGKTRLALEIAAKVAAQFRDGAVWVDLAPVRDAAMLLPEVVRAVAGMTEAPTGDAPDREVLVVLDNCEHLLDAMPEVGRLLAATARVRLLATSRARLQLAAEREYPLPPLPMPSEMDIESPHRLAGNPAVALLLARAPAHVTLTPRTARPLAEVCVRLDGLPLALELAAARLRLFTPAELAFRLEHRMALLTGGARDGPDRHRDLRAALAWSHELLPERERVVFRQLSVFVGDWTMEAAEAVCGVPGAEDAAESLLDKSLIRRAATDEGAAARFGMLASLREFAAEQLEQHDQRTETRTRHARYFTAEAQRWEAAIGTEREAAAWNRLGQVQGDLRAAFDHATAVGDVSARLWLAAALGWYWYTRGSVKGCEPLLDAVGEAVDATTDWQPRAAALTACGIAALALGDLDRAECQLDQAASLVQTHGDQRRLAIASAFRGHAARERGRYEQASAHYTTARELFGQLGNTRGTAWAAHDLALLASERGDLADAESLLREALRLFREIDYGWAIAVTACALGHVLCRHGSVDEPVALFGEALPLHDQLGDRRGSARCLEGLAELALTRGAAATAARLLGAATTERRAGGAGPSEAERTHLDQLDTAITAALGPARADHERHAGRTMPATAARQLATQIAAPPSPAAPDVVLTDRQREVAALVAASNTNRQIARALGISEKTAEVHVRNIMERLHTSSRAGVAAWAVAHGLRPTAR